MSTRRNPGSPPPPDVLREWADELRDMMEDLDADYPIPIGGLVSETILYTKYIATRLAKIADKLEDAGYAAPRYRR